MGFVAPYPANGTPKVIDDEMIDSAETLAAFSISKN
jgi:hypothetical protein